MPMKAGACYKGCSVCISGFGTHLNISDLDKRLRTHNGQERRKKTGKSDSEMSLKIASPHSNSQFQYVSDSIRTDMRIQL